MTVETRYHRSDTESVNALDTEKLRTTQSGSAGLRTQNYVDPEDLFDAFYWGSRVWKRSSAGSETEITPGSPIAQVTRSATGSGIQSNTWNCPLTDLDETDSIVVRVYTRWRIPGKPPQYGTWVLLDTWQTEQLGADTLDAATWTFYYWTQLAFAGWTWTLSFRFDTVTYNSRITNFTWSPPPVVEEKPLINPPLVNPILVNPPIVRHKNFNPLTPISS